MFQKYIKRLLENTKGKIIHQNTGLCCLKTSDIVFKTNHILIEEIKDYCRSRGHIPDKICFVSYFDAEEVLPYDICLNSDSKIIIFQEENKVITLVFMGSFREKYGK